MTGTRWVGVDFNKNIYPWPEPPKGARIRTTIGPDREVELVEFEVPPVPAEPGWYRYPSTFGAVFCRDDGAWLDANGNRVDSAKLPDGLIRLVDSPASEAAS